MMRGFLLGLTLTVGLANAASAQPILLNAVTMERMTACRAEDRTQTNVNYDEAAALRGDPQARRTGPRIRASAEDGGTRLSPLTIGRAVFTDTTMGVEVGEQHTFVGRFAGAPVVLVYMQGYEVARYILADPATGALGGPAGVPVLGPDGHTFASYFSGDEVVEPSYVSIVEWRDGRFRSVSFEGLACGLAWVSADRLSYRTGPGGAQGGHLERRSEGWARIGPDGTESLQEWREE